MPRDETKTPRGSLLPVLMVLALGAALVIAVVAVTGAAGLFVVLAISGVLGFAALHYVLWGWWLTQRLRDNPQDESDDSDDDG